MSPTPVLWAEYDAREELVRRFGGYVPPSITTDAELIAHRNADSRASTARLIADYIATRDEYAALAATLPDGPKLDFARNVVSRMQANIASLVPVEVELKQAAESEIAMNFRPIGSIVANLLATTKAKMDVAALIKAHEAAAAWHTALAEALKADADVERSTFEMRRCSDNSDGFWHGEIEEHQGEYRQAIGRAAVAMQDVPIKWLAVEGVPVDGANVVPMQRAAE